MPARSPATNQARPPAEPAAPLEIAPAYGDPGDRLGDAGERSFGRSWRVWAGVLISAGFLAYAFRGQQIGDVWATLTRFDGRWLPPALLLYFAGVWVRAIRWSVLLRPVVAASARGVFPIVVIGYTANNVLPLRTGELVRAYLIGQRYGARKTAALATIAVERLFDGLTMLAFVLAATTVISLTTELRHLTIIAGALFAAVLLGLVLLTLGGDVRDRLLQLALGPLPSRLADRVERMAMSFLGGLGVLRRKGDLALVALTSVVAWGCEAAMYWTLARGFDAELASAMGAMAALLTTGVANLATLVPAAPGYVGTFEAGVMLAVHDALGVPRGLALSYAILVHAALWFPVTLLGAITWWRLHVSLRQARRFGEGNGPPGPPILGGARDGSGAAVEPPPPTSGEGVGGGGHPSFSPQDWGAGGADGRRLTGSTAERGTGRR